MITIRKSEDRGIYDFGWLNTSHTFSFAKYYNPDFIGFSDLLVINEDKVLPDNGFGKHYHDNMEIISYVLEGELEHTDSLGNNYKIKAGEIQVMTVGTGVMHSEKNPSKDTQVHFFQIWIVPNKRQINPEYKQKDFTNNNKLTLVVSESGKEESLKINQDANLYIARLKTDESIDFEINSKRHFWVQVIKGKISMNETELQAGDGAYGSEESVLAINAIADSEVLLFDLK